MLVLIPYVGPMFNVWFGYHKLPLLFLTACICSSCLVWNVCPKYFSGQSRLFNKTVTTTDYNRMKYTQHQKSKYTFKGTESSINMFRTYTSMLTQLTIPCYRYMNQHTCTMHKGKLYFRNKSVTKVLEVQQFHKKQF
jgi:hypothetical protein